MTTLTEELQKTIDGVLESDSWAEFEKAIEKFQEALPKKEAQKAPIAEHLCTKLDAEDALKKRRGYVAMLAEFKTPEAVEKVTSFLDLTVARSDLVQYRAALSLSKINPPDLQERLIPYLNNGTNNSRMRAIVLRILTQCCSIEEPEVQKYIQEMMKMAQDSSGDNSWAVLRALRNQGDSLEPLSPELESQFVPKFVVRRLRDESEWRDVRVEAASVLGDVKHEWKEAVHALTDVYNDKPLDVLRRTCIESLGRLGGDHKLEVQSALLQALEDDKPDIRVRAGEALKTILKPKAAVQVIVADLLERDDQPSGYIDALRRIGDGYATQLLTENLWHPDPDKQRRASDSLVKLGGEQAIRTLLAQNRDFVDTYTDLLSKADERIMEQHEELMGQARFGFLTSMIIHITVFIIGALILVSAVALAPVANGTDRLVALIKGSGGVLAIFLGMFYQNPVNNIRGSMSNLVKINVAFLGFIRQINQIDATFKQFYLNTAGFGLDQMKETVAQIQIAVDQSLERVQNFIDLQTIDQTQN